MQKFISKYGLAAHLALLAVSPLFLFPFFSSFATAVVLFWMSAVALLWTALSPSQLRDEMLHDARARSLSAIARDPFLWYMLLLVLVMGLRWINSELRLVYDAEAMKWNLGGALFEFLPAGVKGSGALPFGIAVAGTVVMLACRHSLGKAARTAFLYSSSVFAGIAGLGAAALVILGHEGAVEFSKCSFEELSFVGTAFALEFLAAVVSFVGAMGRKNWGHALPLGVLSIGGTLTGAIFFSPASTLGVFAIGGVILFVLSFVLAVKSVSSSTLFKGVLIFAFGLLVPGLIVVGFAPEGLLNDRLGMFVGGKVCPDGFMELRGALSAIAAKAWNSSRWLGTGIGTFHVDIRFLATEADWEIISPLQQCVPSAWWQLVAERGIVGALLLAIAAGFLAWTYFYRLVRAFGRHSFQAACWLAPVSAAAVVATGFVDVSILRGDVLLIVGSLLAVSASSFPQPKVRENDDAAGAVKGK